VKTVVDALIERSSAHVFPREALRPAQRLQNGVTELDVARVMHELEKGVRLHMSRMGRWAGPRGSRLGSKCSPAVQEMIRTGLVRHYRDREGDHLIPAKVHLDLGNHESACHFAGEGMGPMRARLSEQLELVDCLACCDAVAYGGARPPRL
jgi:hypothetical protein